MEERAEEGPGLGLQGEDARMNHFGRVVLYKHIVEVLKTLNKAWKRVSMVTYINRAEVFYPVDARHPSIDGNERVRRILPEALSS